MLPKPCRLRKSKDIQRVRKEGQSWSSPYLVLCRYPNGLTLSRFGFIVGKRIGKAVVRNRVKRLMREAVRVQYDMIAPGWDVVLIAKPPIRQMDYWGVLADVTHLLSVAGLLKAEEGGQGE